MTDPAPDVSRVIQAWGALRRPSISIAASERGQVYKMVVDLAASLRTTEPSTAAVRAAAIA